MRELAQVELLSQIQQLDKRHEQEIFDLQQKQTTDFQEFKKKWKEDYKAKEQEAYAAIKNMKEDHL